MNEFFLSGSAKSSIMIFSWAKYLLPIMDFCNSVVKTVTITCRLSRLYCIITWRLSSQHLLVDRKNLGASLDFSPWRFSLKYLSYAQHIKSPHETQKSPNSSSILQTPFFSYILSSFQMTCDASGFVTFFPLPFLCFWLLKLLTFFPKISSFCFFP